MKTRFSDNSQKLAKSIDNFLILDFDGSLEFIEYYSHNLKIKKDILDCSRFAINRYILELYLNLHNM